MDLPKLNLEKFAREILGMLSNDEDCVYDLDLEILADGSVRIKRSC